MRRIEIVYTPYAERELNSGGTPKELWTIVALPYCIQNMCVGNGMNWDAACPKYLRGQLDKEAVIRAFSRAPLLLAIVSLNPMGSATAKLRFFETGRTAKSFYEVTVNLSRDGKAMTGEIRTTQELFGFIMKQG